MAASRWRSPVDQCPPLGKPILCLGVKGGVFLVNRCEEVIGDRIWVNGVGWRRFTHWMPLPPAPEVK